MMQMKIENADGFKNMADKLATIIEDEVDKLVGDLNDDYLNLLKANSPVDHDGGDPGKLSRSWKGTTKKIGTRGRMVTMENNSGYTHYVEYGHRIVVHGKDVGYQRGRFFVKKSRNKVLKSLPKRYKAMGERIQRRMGE